MKSLRDGIAQIAGFAVLVVCFGLIGCQRNPEMDAHADFDRSVGNATSSAFSVRGHDGLLHVKEITATGVNLLATAPEFSFTIVRKTEAPIEITINLGNVPQDIVLEGLGTGAEVKGLPGLWLARSWGVTLNEQEQTFSTTIATAEDFTYLAFGDIQAGLTDFDEMVASMNGETDASFILGLGDLTESAQADEFEKLIAFYQDLEIPIYATPGNHDTFRGELYQKNFGSATYSFKYRGVRFTSLDSAWASLSGYTWDRFENWVKGESQGTHVVFSHIPSTDISGIRAGHWSSRREAYRFQAISAKFGVDLIMFGHIHSYDNYQTAGIPTVISGGAGGIPEDFDGIGRHFLKVDVNVAEGRFGIQPVEVP